MSRPASPNAQGLRHLVSRHEAVRAGGGGTSGADTGATVTPLLHLRYSGEAVSETLHFLRPELLWLPLIAAPLLGVAYFWLLGRRRREALTYASLSLVRPALAGHAAWKRHVPPALLGLAFLLCLVAAARPTATLLLPSEYKTLVLAMDVSLSMRATDIKPSRIEAAKTTLREFVEKLPGKIRLGLVAFAGTAAAVQSPTDNKDDLLAAIDRFQLQRGTATGSGLLVALSQLFPDDGFDVQAAVFGRRFSGGEGADVPRTPPKPRREFQPVPPGSYPNGSIILLSDGRRTTGPDPLEIAKAAADRGVRVYTVGFGTKDGAEVGFEGFSFYARLDEETLKAIARITEGQYFLASTGAELEKVYEQLNLKLSVEKRQTEISGLLALLAALLVLAALGLSRRWFRAVAV